MNIEVREIDDRLFDAVLVEIDDEGGILIFCVAGEPTSHSLFGNGGMEDGHRRLCIPIQIKGSAGSSLRTIFSAISGEGRSKIDIAAKAGIVPGRDGLGVRPRSIAHRAARHSRTGARARPRPGRPVFDP